MVNNLGEVLNILIVADSGVYSIHVRMYMIECLQRKNSTNSKPEIAPGINFSEMTSFQLIKVPTRVQAQITLPKQSN